MTVFTRADRVSSNVITKNMNSKLLGKWRIIDSEEWAPDMLNMDGVASIEIEKDGLGIINSCQ